MSIKAVLMEAILLYSLNYILHISIIIEYFQESYFGNIAEFLSLGCSLGVMDEAT